MAHTLDGRALETRELFGRIVVVKFFARYCKPCEKTLPEAERLHQEHPEVAFIGVSMDERRSELQATVQRYGLTFPIIFDPDRVVAGRFRVTELPVTFVVNRQGYVHWLAGPDQAEHDLQLALESMP